jgi:hypothetical protein
MLFAAFLGLKGDWHIWLGVALIALALLTVVGLVVGYLAKVTAPQHRKPKS